MTVFSTKHNTVRRSTLPICAVISCNICRIPKLSLNCCYGNTGCRLNFENWCSCVVVSSQKVGIILVIKWFKNCYYRGSPHFVISQFVIPSISWFSFRPQFREFPSISRFWKKKSKKKIFFRNFFRKISDFQLFWIVFVYVQ